MGAIARIDASGWCAGRAASHPIRVKWRFPRRRGPGSPTRCLPLPASPVRVDAALAPLASDPWFVSITRPSDACQANPLADELDPYYLMAQAEIFDGFIYVQRLTPETKPDDLSFEARDAAPGVRALLERRHVIARGELGRWAR